MRLPPEMQPGAPGLRGQLALAVLAGVLAALGQAPFDLWPLAIAGLALLFVLLRRTDGPRRAALIGWAAGIGHFALALFWIVEPFMINAARHGWMAPFALVGMSAGLALFWAMAGAATRTMGATALAFIASFAAVEVARSYVLTGFPWALIGHVWIDTPLVHVAALTGHHGLTL
ncbi:MAG: apolipoprotein N-acyltransferase, partial [Paracoccaceae bacterium]|nr:apolipoprotein N-acyltransferase [Paracoccaceae bacterium]